MKSIGSITPFCFGDPGIADAINHGKLLGRIRKLHPSWKPSRLKFRRLKNRAIRTRIN